MLAAPKKELDNFRDNRSVHNWRLQGAGSIHPPILLTQQLWLLRSMRETMQSVAWLAEALQVTCLVATGGAVLQEEERLRRVFGSW